MCTEDEAHIFEALPKSSLKASKNFNFQSNLLSRMNFGVRSSLKMVMCLYLLFNILFWAQSSNLFFFLVKSMIQSHLISFFQVV